MTKKKKKKKEKKKKKKKKNTHTHTHTIAETTGASLLGMVFLCNRTMDNVTVHTNKISIKTKKKKCGFEVLPNPAYPPDLASSDYHMFPKLKTSSQWKKAKTF